ncbi:MAG: RNA polymerase sigma factor [Sedimentisphaerales bacterium]|nr:RNA polymerase sigma factor [Sedimentisphaerales bacterium]
MKDKTGIEQNESALVCAARDGDREALLKLLEQNWPWMRGLAYNVLGNADDVDEAIQTVCVQVIDKIGTLRQPERFKAWLATVTRHAALGYRKQRQRKPVQLSDIMTDQQVDDKTPSSLEALQQKEQSRSIIEALEQLPDKYREVFILKHIEQHSYTDIAEILDVPITTVQIRLVRARRMIYNHVTGNPSEKIPRT